MPRELRRHGSDFRYQKLSQGRPLASQTCFQGLKASSYLAGESTFFFLGPPSYAQLYIYIYIILKISKSISK